MSQKTKPSPKPSPKNTLFKYFAKTTTPSTPPAPAEKVESIQTKTEGKKLDFNKRDAQDDSEEEEFIKPSKKRRVLDSDDEDSENTDNNKIKSTGTPKAAAKRSVAKDASPAVTPKVAKKTVTVEADPDASFVEEKDALMMVDNLNKIWPHEKLPFLQPDKIMDNKKRRPDHPDYDARTLYVPQEHIKKQTPAMAQWWTLKSNHFDCIFFFKVGKFYELYHSDAIVGVKELGFTFMGKDEHAHSGFPEKAYEKMASQLVEKGYKVARVEQTENPEMMKERCDREGTKDKFSKVMKREICQITDLGTQIFSSGLQKMTSSSDPNFMLAISENKLTTTTSRYGVCFGDTSIGEFWVGEFDDDQQCSRLLTLLSHYSPVLVLHERNGKSAHTEKVIKSLNALKEPLTNDKQMWTAEKTLDFLSTHKFGKEKSWPDAFSEMKDENLMPVEGHKLALKALGGCLWYLENNLLVTQVLSSATFKNYIPPDQVTLKASKDGKKFQQKSMVLDNITLSNLNVIGKNNSLVQKVDYCTTQSGKRLLLEYLCAPSCEVDEIRGRQEAVKQLYDNNNLLLNCRSLLISLNVDLERSLAQIQQFGIRDRMGDHPDSRAILYETATYGKNKIADFAAVLNAFDLLMGLPEMFVDSSSSVLKTLTQTKEHGGCFIDCTAILKKFKNAFDIKEALNTGFAVPERNADEEYDKVLDDIDTLEEELKTYLKKQEKIFGCSLKYFGSDRKRYQIEVPEAKANKASDDYSLESCAGKGKNAVKRFTTDETKEFLARMQRLEESKKEVMNSFAGRVYSKFSKHYEKFKLISGLVSKLDVLAGLAEYARNQNTVCMPEIHEIREVAGESLLKIENGVHPLMNCDDFIPNGMHIPSSGKAFFELITGPNMGGKSTLMREVALLSIMAQVGSFVPAESMELSVIDRIFTRLGANDNIMANQSTFLVELNETSLILKHCTHNSLVLLDELGRGTSTYDGTAIAQSVASYLADLKCRTLFSTHYHSLVDNFYGDERIHLGHMACMVENENSEDITKENVTFLYKYVTGSCPKSFGFNAAKLAGIQLEIIRRAHEIAKLNEADSLKRRITAKILDHSSPAEIKNLLIKFQKCFI